MKYAKVELVPPSPAEFPQVMQGFGKVMHSARTGAWKKMTVKVSLFYNLREQGYYN